MQTRTRRAPWCAVALTLAVMAAVPGSGVAAPDSARAACSGAGTASKDLSRGATRDAVECLLNEARGNNRGDLKHNGDLEGAAQKHSNVMASNDCFSHKCPGEPGLRERVERTGYFGNSDRPRVGEAIQRADDDATPRQVVNSWLNSSENRELIRSRDADDVGVGVVLNGGEAFYTVVFASR
jgi:uncharacterized protein YkwD